MSEPMADALVALTRRLAKLEREAVRLRQGVMTGNDDVALGGASTSLTGVPVLGGLASDGDRVAALTADADVLVLGAAGGPSLVTALPTGPYDGQQIFYEVVEGTVWHLRYNEASASAYKWECLGGPDLLAVDDAFDYPNGAGGWFPLNTYGANPAITVPLGGVYDLSWGFQSDSNANYSMIMGVNASGAGTLGSARAYGTSSGQLTSVTHTLRNVYGAGGVSAAIVCYYWATAANNNNNAGYRWLRVRPVRVG